MCMASKLLFTLCELEEKLHQLGRCIVFVRRRLKKEQIQVASETYFASRKNEFKSGGVVSVSQGGLRLT